MFISSGRSCNCKKSSCLKQYCDCFAVGLECNFECRCNNCLNNDQNRRMRSQAMESILLRDPKAFSGKEELSTFRSRNRGCNCKKSGCQKKYCECYQSGVGCTFACKCDGCTNSKHSVEIT
jgi:hypothetical protein